MRGGGEGWNTRVVALRVDPAVFRFRLTARIHGVFPGWSVHQAPDRAVVATNTGQFTGITPWGWVVMRGMEESVRQAADRCPLHIAWDATGRVHGGSRPTESTPSVLAEGLRRPGSPTRRCSTCGARSRARSVSVGLAWTSTITTDGSRSECSRTGESILSITRSAAWATLIPRCSTRPYPRRDGRGDAGAAAASGAVSLDGGVSAQMLLRANGRRQVWRGWRSVPLGLVAEPVQPAN